jgi:hypothetical protein
MGVSTLFAALSLPQTGPGMWARRFMFANAMITPVIAFIYFYPHFSLGVLLLGTPWLVTAPGSLLALASYFRTMRLPPSRTPKMRDRIDDSRRIRRNSWVCRQRL